MSGEQDGRTRERGRTALAWALAALSAACSVAAVLWNHDLTGRSADVAPIFTSDLLLATAYPLVGAVILSRQPRNRLGWLFLVGALLGPYLLAGQYALSEIVVAGRSGAAAQAAAWLAMWGFFPYFVMFGLLLPLFPDGRALSRGWTRIVRTIGLVLVVGLLARMLAQGTVDASRGALENPLGLAVWPNYVMLVAVGMAFGLGIPVGLVALLQRLRGAQGTERAQLQWLVLGGVATGCALLAGAVLPREAEEVAFSVALLCIPASVVVAMVRHGLFDVEVVLSRTIVYGLLTALVLVGYAGAVLLVGSLTPDRRSAYALVAVVALVAAAGRDLVQDGVDRLLYGERRDPYAVVSRIGGRIDLATGPADALDHLAAELRAVLRLPYAAVLPSDPRLAPVVHGSAPWEAEVLPLTAKGDVVGELRVGHRSRGEEFGRAERAALVDVARRASGLLEAAGLLHDLERSRERLVAAREEERRRLRHDLHDGVGPELAGMALQLDSLARRLGEDPELRERVGALRDQMRRTVAAVRRAVDDLRPPALDELGLVGALRQHVAAYAPAAGIAAGGMPTTGREGTGVDVVAAGVPELPAAVEVAAYRIASEAVANAVRHGQAQRCTVRLDAEPGWLLVEVVDDGSGIDPSAQPGVGLRSMSERAAEVGGRFEVLPAAGGGTVVRARLPRSAR